MEYNTSREKMIIPEYGRHVHKLINHAVSIKDKAERKIVVQAIIDIMGQVNPHLRNVPEFTHKLWDHLFFMSDFKLDVESPYPIPERPKEQFRPKSLPYPQQKIRFKHYGKNIDALVAKAKETKDPEKKKALTEIIANYMKLAYRNWNKENISDEAIFMDLKSMSNGELLLEEGFNFSVPNHNPNVRRRSSGGHSGGRSQHKHSNNRRRNNNSKRY